MSYPQDAAPISIHWQRRLDESLEAGEALSLELGISTRVLDNLTALIALDGLAVKRSTITTPWLCSGGDGVAWAAVVSSATDAAAGQSLEVAPLYGGADRATYMATLATLPAPSTHTRRSRATGLPVSMHSSLLPESQPGVVPDWASLPFVVGAQVQTPAVDPVTAPSEPWLQWISLFVVIGLIISALFI